MCNDKKKKQKYPIANNPLSRNLAYLFKHPYSGHPIYHSIAGFLGELDKIEEEVAQTDPDGTKCSRGHMINIISGNKKPSFQAMQKLCKAYESLYGIKIDPYDLFVDRSKWLNTANFLPEQKEVCENVKYIQKRTILEGILAFSRSETESLDPVSLNRCKYSDDPFYFPIDGN